MKRSKCATRENSASREADQLAFRGLERPRQSALLTPTADGFAEGQAATVRPEPKIAVFLDLFDRAEQEELTYHTLAGETVEELRNAFRRGLSRA